MNLAETCLEVVTVLLAILLVVLYLLFFLILFFEASLNKISGSEIEVQREAF